MKIVRIKGGLGNQMFQYAFAKLLEIMFHEEVKLDFNDYLSLLNDPIRQPRILRFNLSLDLSEKKERDRVSLFPHFGNPLSNLYKVQTLAEMLLNPRYYFERNRAEIDVSKIGKYRFYDGYWQAHSYVEAVREIVKNDFMPKEPISEKTQGYIDKARSCPTTFVGIRRGDFLEEREHYGTFSNDYYLNAMTLIESKYPGTTFLIFSNDTQWCKENLSFGDFKIEYREEEMQVDDFEELMLMRSCQNAIISNSTYNWWAAWLIDNPDKIVVCPEDWFTDNKPIDIIPNDWVRMKR